MMIDKFTSYFKLNVYFITEVKMMIDKFTSYFKTRVFC